MHCGLGKVSCLIFCFHSSKLTLGASHNLARVRRDIYTRDRLIVARQFILELEAAARLRVQVDVVLTSYGQCLTVGREGMVCNRVVEEVVDFWGGHCGVKMQ